MGSSSWGSFAKLNHSSCPLHHPSETSGCMTDAHCGGPAAHQAGPGLHYSDLSQALGNTEQAHCPCPQSKTSNHSQQSRHGAQTAHHRTPVPGRLSPRQSRMPKAAAKTPGARHVVGWESHQAPLSGHPGGERPSPLRSESSGPPIDEEPTERRISPNSAHSALPLPRPPCLLLTTILACDSLSTHHTGLKKAPDCGSGAGHRPASQPDRAWSLPGAPGWPTQEQRLPSLLRMSQAHSVGTGSLLAEAKAGGS